MFKRVLLTLLVATLAGVPFVSAQSAPSPDSRSVEERLAAIEQKLDALEKRVDQATQGLAHKSSDTVAQPSSDRLEALGQKLELLERSRQADQDKAAKAQDAPVVSAGRDGFSISSADKSYRIKFGGYAQADGKTFYDDSAHQLTNSFSVRRARLNIDGSVGKLVDFRIAPEFGNGTTSLYDAYADLKYAPYAVLRGGKFKTPLGLELVQNDSELTFIERSLVSDLVPNRDEGFQLYGDIAGRGTYAVAFMNGASDGTNIDGDTNDGKEFIGRIFATPFAKNGPWLKGLGFGIGASTGRQNGTVLPSLKSTGGQATFFSYAAAAIANGRRLRYSPQLYYYNGPFGLMGEYVESAQHVSMPTGQTTVSQEISNHAWQGAASWVLTGEPKTYKGVVPKKGMLEGGKNDLGFGAWEIAARYTAVNVDPTAFRLKFADPTKSAETARAWSVGLNWYLNRNARLSFDYEQTRFQGGALIGNRPTEKALLNRLQVVF